MLISDIATALSIAISAWVVIASVRLLVRIKRGSVKRDFFVKTQIRPREGIGRKGISLLCHDTGDIIRLRTLLAVEYPDYEVIVVADTLRNPQSMQRIISDYRMVAVDIHTPGTPSHPTTRKMYRSTLRCFRRLLLLDISTASDADKIRAAFDVATYDYILPLWGEEQLLPGAIERLITELSLCRSEALRPISTLVGARLTLYPRSSYPASQKRKPDHTILYESLAIEGDSRKAVRWLMLALFGCAGGIALSVAIVGFSTAIAGIAALTLLAIATTAYAAHALLIRSGNKGVGYGETLSLFCENLLPQIWQIRK